MQREIHTVCDEFLESNTDQCKYIHSFFSSHEVLLKPYSQEVWLCLRHEAFGPKKGSSSPLEWTDQQQLFHGVLTEHRRKYIIVQPIPSSVLIASSHPPFYSSHQRQWPWTSSIDGRTTPAAQTLQSTSVEPHTLQPWLESKVWMETTTTGQWSTEQWSWSSTAET